MASNPKKQAMQEREVRKNTKEPFDHGGHFLPALTTKQRYRNSDREMNRSETNFAQGTLITQTDTKKAVRFARHLELWTEYDRDTGVLLKKGCRRSRDYRAFSCRLNKNSPRGQQSLVVSKPAKLPKQKTKVQSISEAVQRIQRQGHRVNNYSKITLGKYGSLSTKEEGAARTHLEHSPKVQQDQFQTDRSSYKEFRNFSSSHEKLYLNSEEDVQAFQLNNSTSDNCTSLYPRLNQVRQGKRSRILFPQSAEFKACVQCSLPPLCDECKTIDERLLPDKVREERETTNEYKQNSNKGFSSLVHLNTPHIVQLFD